MQTIVIGHRNPDMDSICAAIGYARLKTLQGIPDVIAGRAGNTNLRVDYVLKKFNAETPVFFSDVSPHVGDVMRREITSMRADSPVYDSIHFMEENSLRGLPVVDQNNRCLGLLSVFKIMHYLFPPREEAATARIVQASLESFVRTFGGKVLAGVASSEIAEHVLMVGAMDANDFSNRLKRHKAEQVVVFVGNREDIQMRAIDSNVRCIVVTGGGEVLNGIQRTAVEAGVTIISSPHDTATTVLLARGAISSERMIDREYTSFNVETPLEIARDIAAASAAFIFPVLDENGDLVGVLSKSDFIKPVPRKLILVDHNEMSQAVTGADKIPILEILDHHRLGGFATDSPILFWNNPVGSSCTIVALCYEQSDLPISPETAGLLMAGIVTDTLNLTSPTATSVDRRILEKLSKIANTDPAQLAEEIFAVGSPLKTMAPEQVINADCKQYEQNGRRFTVSQVEEISFARLDDKQPALIEALEKKCKERNLYFAALLITDINTQNSRLIVCGDPVFLHRITFQPHGPHAWDLNGIVSRKKQLLPYLLQCLPAR